MSISYTEALSLIESTASLLRPRLFPVLLPLDSSLGSTSAQDVFGYKTLPPLDNSAMDGFAVTSRETLTASVDNPVILEIIGSIAAGDHPPFYDDDIDENTPPSMTCFHINTGAPFPLPSSSAASSTAAGQSTIHDAQKRYDACLRKEDAKLSPDGRYCTLIKPVQARQHRRKAGEDFAQGGTQILSSGNIVTPEKIAALSCHGIAYVSTVQQPKIAVLSTGKELEQVLHYSRSGEGDNLNINEHISHGKARGEPSLPPSHIYDSNSHYILAALKAWGYTDITRLESLGDNPEEYRRTVARCSDEQFDVLISTGGVSKGQHDYIKETLLKVGAQIQYHGTKMRPGHPALMATYTPRDSLEPSRTLTIFGLPGNPCAAAATLRFMVRPFLRFAMGRTVETPSSKARLVTSSSSSSNELSSSRRSSSNELSSSRRSHERHNRPQHSEASLTDGDARSLPAVMSTSPTNTTHACGEGGKLKTGQHRGYFLAQYEGYNEEGVKLVRTLNKGSGMVRPLSMAHCWVLLKEDQAEESGVLVDCYDIAAGLQ